MKYRQMDSTYLNHKLVDLLWENRSKNHVFIFSYKGNFATEETIVKLIKKHLSFIIIDR